MIRVVINEEELEIDDNNRVAMTIQTNDIAELEDRQSNFSTNIKVPLTQNNRDIMESSEQIQSNSKIPYQKTPARIISNGIDIVTEGEAIIKTGGDEYNLRIFSGIFDFFKSLGDKKLTDLNLSEWNHVMDKATVDASYVNNEGYTYPVVDYGILKDPSEELTNNTTNVPPAVSALRPAIYVHTIVDRILLENGNLDKIGTFWDDEFYKSLVIAHSSETFKFKALVELDSMKSILTADQNIPTTTETIVIFDETTSGNIRESYDTSTGIYIIEDYRADFKVESVLEINFSGTGNVNLRILFGLETETSSVDLVNPSGLQTIKLEVPFQGNEADPGPIIGTWRVTVTKDASLNVDILKNSTFNVEIIDEVKVLADSIVTRDNSFVYEVNPNLPDINQSDLLKAIFQAFSLTLEIKDGEFKVFTFDEIISNKSKAVDWSDKIDLSSAPKVSYEFGDYAQSNTITFSNEDDVSSDFGSGEFTINDGKLDEKKEVIGFDIAATDDVEFEFTINGSIERITCAKIPGFLNTPVNDIWDNTVVYGKGDTVDFGFYSWISNFTNLVPTPPPGVDPQWVRLYETEFDDSLRIISVWDYKDFKIGSMTNQKLGKSLLGQSIVDQSYSGLAEILDNVKVVNAKFLLNEADIQGFKPEIPVYVKFFDNHFFVNIISQYRSGFPTKVTLVRI